MSFEMMYHASRCHAEMHGRRVIRILVGAEEWEEVRQTYECWMHTNIGSSAIGSSAIGSTADSLMTYAGIPVGRMKAAGVAVITRGYGQVVKFKVVGKL